MHGVERAHGLPPARRQARRRHGSGNRYLDNLYEPFGLCVELDGNAAHPAEGRWRDTRRDNANLAQGTRTLRYGWPDVTEYRCRTAAEVAEVLRSQGWTGTLRRCGPGCTAVEPQEQDKPRERGGRRSGASGRSKASAGAGRINNDYEERAACRLRLERELTSGCGAWAGCVAMVAAFTRASSSRASSPSSGFHCTPRPHRWPCTSSASTT